jgi:hypothetical protein
MKKIYLLLIIAASMAVGAGLVLSGTGCDELDIPCDMVATSSGMPGFDLKFLESWRQEDGFAILRFMYTEKTISSVCTDRTLSFQGKLEKRFESTIFTVLPQARLIWKYAAPVGKAVLMGGGTFKALFDFSTKTTTVYENPISLAYAEGESGGFFIPGVEIKIRSLGNQSDDFNYVWNNFLLIFDYKVTYHVTY